MNRSEPTPKKICYNLSTMTITDSNGVELFNGDSVQLTRDLKVKGKGFLNFKKGKSFKNISVDEDNENHIKVR